MPLQNSDSLGVPGKVVGSVTRSVLGVWVRCATIPPIALVLSACPPNVSATLGDESTARDLVFHISEANGESQDGPLGRFLVYDCRDPSVAWEERLRWEIRAVGVGTKRIGELRYGDVPDGFEEEVPAAALAPSDCYYADPGHAGAYFRVDSAGAAHALQR